MPFGAAQMPCSCCEHDGLSHVLIRCGCKYEGEQRDEKHHIDDAYHRLFCHSCLKYCSKDQACPSPLPNLCVPVVTAVTTTSKYSHLTLVKVSCAAALACTFGVLAAARSWIFDSLFWWPRWSKSGGAVAADQMLAEKQAPVL